MTPGHRIGLAAARLLLGIWALGLVVAAFQLSTWRQELSTTLMQLKADAQFRARVQRREAVDPEWYRRKALVLLSATERLRRDKVWTAFVPGSWRTFDNLEERVHARIEREFGEIVVETIRRELLARGSQLTGVPLLPATGGLEAGTECEPPPWSPGADRGMHASADDLPELDAVGAFVASVRKLDEAVDAYLALHQTLAPPEQLHKLVRYTLGKELPGSLARSARLFHGPEEVNVGPALMRTQLQSAARCTLLKGMGALHARLLHGNDLFRLEQALAQHSEGLFEAGARPSAFGRTLERYRAVHALLQEQHALLAKGRNGWMRSGHVDLGPSYAEVLAGIAGTRLLGPEAIGQLEQQSAAAFVEFRRQFENTFGGEADAGIAWLEQEQRFGLSPERDALRTGLAALLQMPIMREVGDPPGPRMARVLASWPGVIADAGALADLHDRFTAETLPLFPASAQGAVARLVHTRICELIYQRGLRALKAHLAADAALPLDPLRFQKQREQVGELQAILKETGGAYFAGRLAGVMDGEVLRRLGLIHADWQQPLHDPRGSDFAWWQGEPVGVVHAVGSLAARLDLFSQQAKALLALAGPTVAADPGAHRWLALQAELERYQVRRSDSSLLRMERYLAALGPDFRRENCAERLAANAPDTAHDDEITQRHRQIHQALAQRCGELRTQAAPPPASATAK